MTTKCRICGEKIDTDHDEHYFCLKHSKEIACSQCYITDHYCTICGERLQYKDASYQKKIFFNPTTRGMLGF